MDTASHEHLVVRGLDETVGRVLTVARADGAPVEWRGRPEGLELTTARPGAADLATVYRVEIEPRDAERIAVQAPPDTGTVRLNDAPMASLAAALGAAAAGDVVTIGPGRYADGPFP